MKLTTAVPIRIPFHDIDVMHIVWHGHYFKYFEHARTALMQKLGLDWPALKAANIAMPVVDTQTQYRKPVVYDQLIEVEASIEETAYPELIIHYEIRAIDQSDEILSSGRTRQVYMSAADQKLFFLVPEFVKSRFQAAIERESQRHEK